MCGILGLCSFDKESINVKNLHQCNSILRHRGPDDEGYLLVDFDRNELSLCKGSDSDPKLQLPDITSCYDGSFSLASGFPPPLDSGSFHLGPSTHVQ